MNKKHSEYCGHLEISIVAFEKQPLRDNDPAHGPRDIVVDSRIAD